MAHLIVHALSGAALAPWSWAACIGAVLPDLTLAANEVRLRRSGLPPGEFFERLGERQIVAYRVAHSVLVIGALAFVNAPLAAGMLVHVLLDLPTHDGRFRQRPLWPLAWRWPIALVLRRWRR